ncbi:putative receptor-like protein kinase-like [Capsicum annuum]|nr:putative receptor-like protein kinase-like [Capsicum annuum]
MGGRGKGTLHLRCIFSENWISQLLLKAKEIAQKCKPKEMHHDLELHYSCSKSKDDNGVSGGKLRKAAARENSDNNYPHNILLDDNFCRKISDFGLAKLCLKTERGVSILGPRGPIGYIAPEIICKNLGGVSHKSDAYSYGMMVLEMVGGRKNVDAGADRTSEIYFPHWLYQRIELDEDLQLIGIMNGEENECARKRVIASLWCIQTDPSNRPSMSKVVEMLEGKLDSLEIPPKPYLYSPSRIEVDSSTTKLM